MELLEALRTNPAVREFTAEPVPDEVVAELLDVARFAPSGGNRQPWRVAVVRDRELRRRLVDLCGPVQAEYVAIAATGVTPFAPVGEQPVVDSPAAVPNPVFDRVEDVPVMLVVAADLSRVAMMDGNLERPPITAGASVYPFVHALLLAARDRDLGGVLMTFLARAEEAARPLLGLPDGWAIAAMVFIGHPAKRATKLRRRSVAEFATVDRFDGPPLP